MEESVYRLGEEGPRPKTTMSAGATTTGSSGRTSWTNVGGRSRAPGRVPQHQNSAQVALALNPIRGVRDMQERCGKAPKDHAKMNIKSIKEQSSRNHVKRAEQERQHSETKRLGHVPRSVTSSPRAKDDQGSDGESSARQKSRDFVRENAQGAAAQRATQRFKRREQEGEGQDWTRRDGYGKVPGYLLQRKVELAKEAEARRAAEEAEDVPAGMRVMPEEERQETLELLRESKRDAESRLQLMPFSCETPSQKRAKEDLEKRLAELEEAERAFSKQRVLIRTDE